MKKLLSALVLGVSLPAVVWSTADSAENFSAQSSAESEYPRPYVVEVINPFGEKTAELKGVSKSRSAAEIAAELGAENYIKDRYQVFPQIELGIGSKITHYQTPRFLLRDGKKKSEIRSWGQTVGEVLADNGVELGQEDKINFAKDDRIEPNTEIVIVRVARTTVVEKKPIDFKITKKDDPKMDQGKTRVEQAGKKGERHLTYEVIREDGVEVKRTLKKSEVAKEPVTEVIWIGTKPVITGWCKYNDVVIDAAAKNSLDPNKICALMRKESNGNPNSISGSGHKGLFQYTDGFWTDASRKAGYAGADWSDPRAQIYTTAWALTHGYQNRW